MGKINKAWHEKNKMPEKATPEQRARWHIRHSVACACRGIPAGILPLVKKMQSAK